MKQVVLSYTNPDLDGVASALAIATLCGESWHARLVGAIDDETRFVLQHLQLPPPEQLLSWNDVGRVWLVDTHHLRQLPADLPTQFVVRVTDHHPGGDPASFPNAEIQNEEVGAVATLVGEQYKASGAAIPSNIAVLLQAAIVSNTLEFQAPSTSTRDKQIYELLGQIKPIDSSIIDGMRECRRGVLKLKTELLVRRDTKAFDTPHGKIIVGQIEAPGALEVLTRSGLFASLIALSAEGKATSAVLNIVDTARGNSAVVATNSSVVALLAKSLDAKPDVDGVILVPRVLQRKSDILPVLLRA